MKKILLIFSILAINISYAKTCMVTYVVKKSNPAYNHIFYREKFYCSSLKDGINFQKNLGCRKRGIIDKNWKKYTITICPISITLIKN